MTIMARRQAFRIGRLPLPQSLYSSKDGILPKKKKKKKKK
jgi:hypothetical protein